MIPLPTVDRNGELQEVAAEAAAHTGGPPAPPPVDPAALAAELRSRIQGEVRFDGGSRALYATDASNYRQVPIGVVIPRDTEDVIRTVAAVRQYGAPLLARGGGTSIAGQSCNVAVLMDFSKYMNRILEIDPERRRARVQPGVVLDHLRHAAMQHQLTFGPDPATHQWCTLGGMLGNDSCGVHSVMARMAGTGSRTADNTEELEVLTYDGIRMRVGPTSEAELEAIIRAGGRRGEIYGKLKALRDRYADQIRRRFPKLPRRVSGYNLDQLLPENGFNVARALVGTECTCVLILEATVSLISNPRARTLLVLGYPDVFSAADHVMDALERRPIGLEALDSKFVNDLKKKGLDLGEIQLLPPGEGWLLVEFGGDSKTEADEQARGLMAALKKRSDAPSMKLFDDPAQEKMVWEVRDNGLGATAHVPGEKENWEGWEDSAVPPEHIGAYLRDLRKLLDKFRYETDLYGHFGDGCVHARVDWELKTAEGIRKWRSFMEEAADLVVSYGGSLSGEHGDGQARGELLPKMFGEELVQAFREFKAIWDPDWKMNPGKVVDPYRLDQNLRYGAHYHQPPLKTHFQYPDDHFSFAHAMERCVGVGKCRKDGGTMCPSYHATREEMHATRGRARLLFEMLHGSELDGGWKSEAAKEALHLCLSCKGCKGECPVQVDMATYKAEFMSHYYEGRLRPRQAYAFGMIHRWARLASLMPGLVNFVTQSPLLGDLARALAGIAPARRIPTFAPQTFKAWFRSREGASGRGGEGASDSGEAGRGLALDFAGSPPHALAHSPRSVILWPDTFNDHFHPEVAQAAVEVLEAAGFQVIVPEQDLCCGRPLYDYGMLDTARQWLRQILTVLQPQVEAGIPVVGLEPSCISVFREELTNLFPNDVNAMRLRQQSYLLSEFLEQQAPNFQPPKLGRKAVVHGHCHHKAIMKMETEEALLKKMGLDFQLLDSGCCGMAGGFGFEPGDHYEVSLKCGERVLLPAVREAAKDTLIITDGFSCREQIAQCTDREALHLAQVIQMALRADRGEGTGENPERACSPNGHRELAGSSLKTAVLIAGSALAAGGLAYLAARSSQNH